MAIDYNWSRVESKEQSGKVISWVVGLSATKEAPVSKAFILE